jgi:hypothetical protein
MIMYPEIKAFAFIEDKKLYVEFEDGKKGLFDMAKYVGSDFFSALDNDAYFKRAFLAYGVISWPQGQDISPETVALELVPFDVPEGVALIRENTCSNKA